MPTKGTTPPVVPPRGRGRGVGGVTVKQCDGKCGVGEDSARETVRKVIALFAGGPDTPCRTTWPNGVECVEVPLDDLRKALSPDAD